MEYVPVSLGLAFVLVVVLAVGLFLHAAHYSRRTLGVLLGGAALQSAVALRGFYAVSHTVPPHALALVAPALLLTGLLFGTARGRQYLDGLDLKTLTLLHVVRIPVELVLFGLFAHGAVPELMTFAGRNWDILSGLSAPLVYFLAFQKRVLRPAGLLAWNIGCLGLLLNIVGHAFLSAPGVFQRLAFEQPNVAILHFPFNLLPAVVVPLVLLAHLAAIRQLVRGGLDDHLSVA